VFDVIGRIGSDVARVYVVDDRCPLETGAIVAAEIRDERVVVIRHQENQGVGGAVMSGYRAAIEDGCEVLVKIDGDGQMAPELIPFFVKPIVDGRADYTKGNRFYDLDEIGRMPPIRIFGNAVLSFFSKLSTGYWEIFDPTNGYTAIHASVARHLPFDKISRRYFFETDMLFRLGTMRAVVLDVPMDPVYGDERSGLRVARVLPEFLLKHARNFVKRIFYSYFLRDLSIASVELVVGVCLLLFALVFGGYHWGVAVRDGTLTPVGTVMLTALSALAGLQLTLAFLSYDMRPRVGEPLHGLMPMGLKAVVHASRSKDALSSSESK
jgi:glycosyltransferase involved in cell wall biosynthesis